MSNKDDQKDIKDANDGKINDVPLSSKKALVDAKNFGQNASRNREMQKCTNCSNISVEKCAKLLDKYISIFVVQKNSFRNQNALIRFLQLWHLERW